MIVKVSKLQTTALDIHADTGILTLSSRLDLAEVSITSDIQPISSLSSKRSTIVILGKIFTWCLSDNEKRPINTSANKGWVHIQLSSIAIIRNRAIVWMRQISRYFNLNVFWKMGTIWAHFGHKPKFVCLCPFRLKVY